MKCHEQCLSENKTTCGMIWEQTGLGTRNQLRLEMIEFFIDMYKMLRSFQIISRENEEVKRILRLKIGIGS